VKRNKLWQLLKKDQSSKYSRLKQSHPEAPQLNLYQSISELPLSRFIDAVVDNNLFSLIKSGNAQPDMLQLSAAWKNILDEYTEAMGSHEYKLYISLLREKEQLIIDYNLIRALVYAMHNVQDYIISEGFVVDNDVISFQKESGKSISDILRYNFVFNNKDNTSYRSELDKAIRRSGIIKIQIDLKAMALEAIQKKNIKSGGKMDRKYFDSILITISDHAKYEITESITVSKFCERIKRYNNYCEQLKTKTMSHGR